MCSAWVHGARAMPRAHALALLGMGTTLILAALLVSPGLYTIDELVYLIGADTLA